LTGRRRRTYKQYLLGCHFVIRTDHAALQWLRRTPEPMAQLARWLVFIEQFDFDVLHRQGARHDNVDGLSRKPMEADEESFLVQQGIGDAEARNRLTAPTYLMARQGSRLTYLINCLLICNCWIRRLDRLPGRDCSRLKSPVLSNYCQSLRLPRCFTVNGNCWSLLMECCTVAKKLSSNFYP